LYHSLSLHGLSPSQFRQSVERLPCSAASSDAGMVDERALRVSGKKEKVTIFASAPGRNVPEKKSGYFDHQKKSGHPEIF